MLRLLFLIPFFLLSGAAPNPFSCTGTNYTANTPYQTNLNTLLLSLASESSSTNYKNATVGIGTNRIYGLFNCEGDLNSSDCQTCVQSATSNITTPEYCPHSRQAITWFDYCLVRYSDTNFFGVVSNTEVIMALRIPDPSVSPVPYKLVANLVQMAALRRPMFASITSTSMNLYVMAQCTGDLTSAGCSQCLTTTLRDTNSSGGSYMSTSCRIRYDVYQFLHNLTSSLFVESTCSPDSLPSSNNVNTLLSDITYKSAPTGFYNGSQSQLYGLALCRGDISVPSDDCSSCLTQASSTLMAYCPNSTQGTVWYEKCMIKYSNDNFFGYGDNNGKSYCGVDQVSNDVGDSTIKFVTGLLGVAANSRLMFAANETGAGGSQPIYVLVQCSRDLSSDGCKSCLENGMSVVSANCKQAKGWRYLSGSCNIRYEVVPFFNTSAIEIGESALPPESQGALPPESQGAGGGRKGKLSSSEVGIILSPVLGAVLVGTFLNLVF